VGVTVASLISPTLAVPQASPDLSYDIEAVVDLDRQTIRGLARLEIPFALLWSPSEVRLDLMSAGKSEGERRLRVESVSSDGKLLTIEESDNLLRVMLPTPTVAGEEVVLDVVYTSGFNNSFDMLGYYSFWSHEPGAYWYPDVVSSDGERARFKDFEVTLDHPEAFTVLTTGIQNGTARQSNGRIRASFSAPHVEGFAVNLAEGFELLKLEGDGYSVMGLLPTDEPEAFRKAVALAAEAVEWYRDAYGFFPVKQIGIIPGPSRWAGGFPLSNVFMIHRANLTDSFLRWITAHELGHYYWGLYVLSSTADRLDWLNLANGIWADHLYLARTSGRTVTEVLRDGDAGDMLVDYLEAMLENREQRLGIGWDEERELGFDYNSLIRHGKATVGVYLQARRLGEEGFLDVQRQLLKDYRFKPLSVAAFTDRLEAAGATGAGEFFERWARGDARIEFVVDRVESEQRENGWMHRVHISQSGTIPYDLDVELIDADGNSVVRTLTRESFDEDGEIVLEEPLAVRLADVRLDPAGKLPMWNSSHIGMRRAFLSAMYRADQAEPFLTLAEDYLRAHPSDDLLRLSYLMRLFASGRHQKVVKTMDPTATEILNDPIEACADRYACWSAIVFARSLNALGRSDEAEGILRAIEASVDPHRLTRRWTEAFSEIEANTGR
jgi:hypothetical protein